eukprot:CAMPEP_0119105958 /NCGR_PEP_ID=MMETSP1180-20130426/3784_1 /TAXON_ID=3052 ORGANISM="Chlamydomonas cf sp, Strain CCMP681" /NCGR_SAMPLE_ID=MMETSP1180 /ASSEMBLY_ACC=CAM_ASM_000741 /LENGTH=406 /DNA_ID=CAMNT_0007091155 /DNA_START=60 /DNA_END=1276 /DNA_ORIENTATION=+
MTEQASTGDGNNTEDASFTQASPVLAINEEEYEPQLARKLEKLQALFSSLGPLPALEVFRSERSHYRMRAEFTVWGTSVKTLAAGGDPDVHYVMYDSSSGIKPAPRIRIDQFPVGSRLMNELMTVVREEANRAPAIRERLFQVNFHTALSGESMVTLIYHKVLDDVWREAGLLLRARLAKVAGTNGHIPHVIGRSRKQRMELDHAYITEVLQVNGKSFTNRQVEGSFSQPNGGVCQHMLSWAQRVTTPTDSLPIQSLDTPQALTSEAGAAVEGNTGDGTAVAVTTQPGLQHDMLELYCGNGNFTIPLASNFRRVVATEMAKTSVDAARHNMTANGLSNIFVARMSSEEFSEAWRTKATKRRLQGLGDWDSLRLDTILVDPPRSGLDAATVKLVSAFDRVVYISCNP